MSTQQPLTKIGSAIIFISGAYLFFITVVIAPYINVTVFSAVHSTTKFILVSSAGIIASFQLFFLVPRIQRSSSNSLTTIQRVVLGVSLLGSVVSLLWSASVKTSLFGMFMLWEHNVGIYIVYFILFTAWYVYFIVLRSVSLEKTVFHTLMTLACIVTIFYSLGEFYLWQPTTGYISQSVSRISLGFRNPLLAAYFLGMLWSFGAIKTVLSLTEQKKNWQGVFQIISNLLLFSGITFSLILTFTRSAWIAAALGFVLFIGIKLYRDRKAPQTERALLISRQIKLVVAACLLSALVFMIGFLYRKEITLRNSDLTIESQNTLTAIAQSLGQDDQQSALAFYQNAQQYSSAQIRLLEWKWGINTWTGSVKNFLFGTGLDAGFFEMPKFRDKIFNSFPTDSATKPFYVRNLYINTVMQIGIVASVGVFYFLFVGIRKLLNQEELDLPALSVIFAFLFQGLFYYSTQIPTVLFVFALAYVVAAGTQRKMILVRQPTLSEKMLLLAMALGLLAWILPIIKAELSINQYSQGALPVSVDEMAASAKIPINNNVLKRFLVYNYADNVLAQPYLTTLATSKDVDDLRIASDAYYLLAKKNGNVEDVRSSITALQNLLAIDATLPATWDGLGLRYLYIGEFQQATEAFTKAIELKPDYWYSYLHMGEVTRQQCNPKQAIEWYLKAEAYVPSAQTEIIEAQAEVRTPRPECSK